MDLRLDMTKCTATVAMLSVADVFFSRWCTHLFQKTNCFVPSSGMGQGLSAGFCTGAFSNLVLTTIPLPMSTRLGLQVATTGLGLSIDLLSDLRARTGTVIIDRQVVLNATDEIRHVYSFYARNDAHPVGKLVAQKHEWVVLESFTHRFYTVQKAPATGDVRIDFAVSLRNANDHGLRIAGRPLMSGETRLHRADQEFDVSGDLQVAYVIAWLRKEDPRWAFSTENSRQFCTRLRFALNDF